jgi:hypothetical protein
MMMVVRPEVPVDAFISFQEPLAEHHRSHLSPISAIAGARLMARILAQLSRVVATSIVMD